MQGVFFCMVYVFFTLNNMNHVYAVCSGTFNFELDARIIRIRVKILMRGFQGCTHHQGARVVHTIRGPGAYTQSGG